MSLPASAANAFVNWLDTTITHYNSGKQEEYFVSTATGVVEMKEGIELGADWRREGRGLESARSRCPPLGGLPTAYRA